MTALINIADIVRLARFVNTGDQGPIPFMHLGDVNADGNINALTLTYLTAFYFKCGACPLGDWVL